MRPELMTGANHERFLLINDLDNDCPYLVLDGGVLQKKLLVCLFPDPDASTFANSDSHVDAYMRLTCLA